VTLGGPGFLHAQAPRAGMASTSVWSQALESRMCITSKHVRHEVEDGAERARLKGVEMTNFEPATERQHLQWIQDDWQRRSFSCPIPELRVDHRRKNFLDPMERARAERAKQLARNPPPEETPSALPPLKNHLDVTRVRRWERTYASGMPALGTYMGSVVPMRSQGAVTCASGSARGETTRSGMNNSSVLAKRITPYTLR